MQAKPLLYAAGAILLWSSLATLGALTRDLPPFFVVGCSLLTGSLLSLHKIREWKVPVRTLLTGVYGLFGYHFALFFAFRHAPAVEVNLLNYLWPLLIVLLSPLFLPGTRLTPRHLAASLLGFGGAALIVGGTGEGFSGSMTGYALAVAAALIWSSFSLSLRRLPAFPSSAVGGFCLISGLLALLCHILVEPAAAPTPAQWINLIALGAGPMGLAFFLWDHALKHGDPRQIGTLSYVTPLLSTLLLLASGQGSLGSSGALAICMILGGAVLGTTGRSPTPQNA